MSQDGVTIDADVMSQYYQESVSEEGEIYCLINKIVNSCGIALSDLIEHEWKQTTGNQFFNIWFDEQLVNGRLNYIKNRKIHRDIKKKIHDDYGLPKKDRDIEYIKVAYNTETIKYILALDMHLFDPKKKSASSAEKYKARDERKGKLCKFLKKDLKITVGLCCHCVDDLSSILPT